MSEWQKMDLWGKVLVLFSVFVQVFFLADISGAYQRSFMFSVLENQANERMMIMVVARRAAPHEPEDTLPSQNLSHYNSGSINYKELNDAWATPTKIANWVVGVLFLLGSLLLLAARYREFEEKNAERSPG
jgi:hypothetical protein